MQMATVLKGGSIRTRLICCGMVGLALFLLACESDRPVPMQPSVQADGIHRSIPEPVPMSPYNPNQSVSSDDAGATPAAVLNRQAIMIEGNIVQVMESYPLQLMVETSTGRYHVALSMETRVTQQGQIVDQNSLKSGMHVQIEGQSSTIDDHAMTAEAVTIQ